MKYLKSFNEGFFSKIKQSINSISHDKFKKRVNNSNFTFIDISSTIKDCLSGLTDEGFILDINHFPSDLYTSRFGLKKKFYHNPVNLGNISIGKIREIFIVKIQYDGNYGLPRLPFDFSEISDYINFTKKILKETYNIDMYFEVPRDKKILREYIFSFEVFK